MSDTLIKDVLPRYYHSTRSSTGAGERGERGVRQGASKKARPTCHSSIIMARTKFWIGDCGSQLSSCCYLPSLRLFAFNGDGAKCTRRDRSRC